MEEAAQLVYVAGAGIYLLENARVNEPGEAIGPQAEDSLDRLREVHATLHPTEPPLARVPVHFFADANAQVAVLRAAQRLNADFYLGAVGPEPALPPRPSNLPVLDSDANLAERAAILAEEILVATGQCRPVQDGFGAVASADPSTRAPLVHDAVRDGLRQCACAQGMDVPALVYLTIAVSASRPARVFPLARDAQDRFVLPAGITDSSTIQRLVDARVGKSIGVLVPSGPGVWRLKRPNPRLCPFRSCPAVV